jgi:hypothetical protein
VIEECIVKYIIKNTLSLKMLAYHPLIAHGHKGISNAMLSKKVIIVLISIPQ